MQADMQNLRRKWRHRQVTGKKTGTFVIAENCSRVPAKGATVSMRHVSHSGLYSSFLQMESSGHSISPGRFDQYMYPYYKKDMEGRYYQRSSTGID